MALFHTFNSLYKVKKASRVKKNPLLVRSRSRQQRLSMHHHSTLRFQRKTSSISWALQS